MKKVAASLACTLGLVAFAAPANGAGTHVAINSWHVYAKNHALHKVAPGSTFKACASKPTAEIDAKGKVKGAQKDAKFKEVWSVRSKVDSVFHVSWGQSGNFTDYFGINANDGSLKTGKWSVKLVQGSKTIGKSSITIRTKNSC